MVSLTCIFSESTKMSIAKPQLRGLLQNQIKKNLIISGVLVTALVVAVKFLRNDPKKRDYAEFYK